MNAQNIKHNIKQAMTALKRARRGISSPLTMEELMDIHNLLTRLQWSVSDLKAHTAEEAWDKGGWIKCLFPMLDIK